MTRRANIAPDTSSPDNSGSSDFLGGDVGVAINACLYLTGALQYGMRQSAEVENMMTSVERVMEYGELKTENYSPTTDDKDNANCKFV